MSFILDALKKAEAERSRQSGPVLMDVRIAAPRRRLPLWAWLLGGVLLANLGVLGWLLLRTPATVPAGQLPDTAATAPPPSLPAVAAAPLPQPVTGPVAIPDVAMPAPPAAPPAMAPPPTALAEAPPGTDGLPTMQDLLASGVSLPPLQLNVHMYDPAPASRYVRLNARRMVEGDELPDGTRLERITPRGVVLDVRGRRFVLLAGE